MIIKDYGDHIGQFESFLKDRLRNIDDIGSSDQLLFRQVLYVSFLDSLAACIYPKRSNKERFIALLEEFANWKYAHNYCFVHLAKFTSITSDPIFRNLRQFVQEEVKDWPNKVNGLGIIRLENLPDKERVKSCWNHTFKTSGEKSVNIEDFKYSNLMYMLRNSLVHQFQGKGSEMGTGIPKNEPYYQLYKGFDESLKLTPNSIELVFPTPMLQTICKDALKNVCTYLREGNINPHPYYYSGDYWLNHLNG